MPSRPVCIDRQRKQRSDAGTKHGYAQGGRLEHWALQPPKEGSSKPRLIGYLFEDDRKPDGTYWETSGVHGIDFTRMEATTRNTFYKLGSMAPLKFLEVAKPVAAEMVTSSVTEPVELIVVDVCFKPNDIEGQTGVYVKFNVPDAKFGRIIAFYPDELSFTEEEFLGLTAEECRQLFTKKDIAYLQS